MTPMKITSKRKERLDKERADRVSGIERVRREKKTEYLIKLRKGQMGKKAAVERAAEAFSHGFELMTKPELLENRHTYERMKKIAEGNKNERLVHHCEDVLGEINKWLKERK